MGLYDRDYMRKDPDSVDEPGAPGKRIGRIVLIGVILALVGLIAAVLSQTP